MADLVAGGAISASEISFHLQPRFFASLLCYDYSCIIFGENETTELAGFWDGAGFA